MPRRTNDFQSLVAQIHRLLDPHGAKITESAMMQASGTSAFREVDVLIETSQPPYKLKIAVEAKDESRPVNLGTFDSLLAKYRGECRVLVDKFVIVASAGFSSKVIEKAREIDVELLTLHEGQDADWSKWVPGTIHFRVAPHVAHVRFIPTLPAKHRKTFLKSGAVVCTCCGRVAGSPMQFATCEMFHRLFPKRPDVVEEFNKVLAQRGHATMKATRPLRKIAIRSNGKDFQVEKIEIEVKAVDSSAPLRHRKYELGGLAEGPRRFHRLDAAVGGKAIDVLFMDDDSRRLAISVGNPCSGPQKLDHLIRCENRSWKGPGKPGGPAHEANGKEWLAASEAADV